MCAKVRAANIPEIKNTLAVGTLKTLIDKYAIFKY